MNKLPNDSKQSALILNELNNFMTLRQRWWLSKFFILLFFIITPLILAYATGYHINWRYLKLEKTGLLEIKTVPDKAQININELRAWLDQNRNLTTPLKLKNLRPNNYTVNIKLSGYHDWRKILAVKPAETTFAKDIRLFKQAIPVWLEALPATGTITTSLIDSDKFNLNTKNPTTSTINDLITEKELTTNWLETRQIKLACSLPDKKIAYANQFELWLADPKTKTTTLVGRFSQSINWLICLPDTNNYLIYGHDNSWQLIELDDRQGRNIWKLADLDQLGTAAINKKSDQLYFYGHVGSTTGLFSLAL
jgi:hypothetical protein